MAETDKMTVDFAPRPHEEAAGIIAGKRPVDRAVFDGLLPELRGRAFTITGVQGAEVMQRVRDGIAALPRGANWDDVKADLIAELEPFLGDEAARRAEILMRTHGFQAYQAANWRAAQEDEDTTHLQYLATEDDKVRDTHKALNGIVLPKNDPFWQRHYPPWEWGCRCRVRSMNPDLVDMEREADATRPPEEQRVIEGPMLDKLRQGTLVRENRVFDVTPPADRRTEGTAFEWHPDDLRMPVGELKARYDAESWEVFEGFAKRTMVGEGETVWDWLNKQPGAGSGERGVRQKAAGGNAISDVLASLPDTASAGAVAKALEASARREAAVASPRINEAVAAIGGKTLDLEYQVKSRDSIKDKISRFASGKKMTVKEAALKINDATRYTAVFKAEEYTANTRYLLEKLQAEGYKVKQIKNFWGSAEYKGINITLVAPSGAVIEVQAHTAESHAAKGKAHGIYEKLRGQKRKAYDLQKENVQVWSEVKTPPGATGLI